MDTLYRRVVDLQQLAELGARDEFFQMRRIW